MNICLKGLILLLAALVMPLTSFAGCERADIEFYLQKKFTPEQITQICGVANSKTSEPADKALSAEQTEVILKVLNENLRIKNAQIVDGRLQFVQPLTIKSGQKDLLNSYPIFSVERQISIALKDLKVLSASHGIKLIKDAKLQIGNHVQSEVMNLAELSQGKRQALEKYTKAEDAGKLSLKFKFNGDVDAVSRALQDLAAAYQ